MVAGDQLRHELRGEPGREPLKQLARLLLVLVGRKPEAEAKLGIVLEERIRPRGAAAARVRAVGSGGQVSAVDRRAAGCVSDERAVAEELRHQLDVGRLAAARARPRILEQRLQELGTFHVEPDFAAVGFGQAQEELVVRALGFPQRQLGMHVDGLVPRIRLVLGGADHHAEAATGAILGGDLDRVPGTFPFGAAVVRRLERGGSTGQMSAVVDLGADGRMRTDHRALVALDAEDLVPDRDLGGNVALLPARGADRERAVHRERRNGKQIALARHHHRGDLAHEIGCRIRDDGRQREARGDLRRHRHFVEVRQRLIDGLEVLLDYGGALLAVRLLHALLDGGDGLVLWQDAGDGKEAGLHHDVDAALHAGGIYHRERVDEVEADALVDQRLLHLAREMVPDRLLRVRSIEQEDRARRGVLEHVELVEEGELVAADEPCLLHQITGARRPRAEAQVRDGHRPRLLRVVDEVALGVVVRLLADDLDRVLVRPDSAVGAETEEDRSHHVVALDVQLAVVVDR